MRRWVSGQDQVLSTKEIYLPQRDKGQGIREKEREYKGEEGNKGKGTGAFVPEWDKELPLDREETDVAHKQVAVYKGKGGNPVRMRSLILTEHVN